MGICSEKIHFALQNVLYVNFLLVSWGRSNGSFWDFKTLEILKKHLFFPHMKRDLERIFSRCITRQKPKSRVKSHGSYKALLVLSHPWIDVSMDFELGLPRTRNGKDSILLLQIDFQKWHILSYVIKLMIPLIQLNHSLGKLFVFMLSLK